MRKTEEKKGNIVRHIQSARQWLERAEHAVNTESAARGELDLILARAEVQLAQEKRSGTAELPAKIITYALRPQNLLAISLGGLAVCVLLIFNTWNNYGQGVNMPAVHLLQSKAQIEVPAARELNTPLAIAPPGQDGRNISEMPRSENKNSFDNPAPSLPYEKSDVAVVRSTGEPAKTVQAQTTSVSEQEIRMLMRTAERVLRSPN
jgi:hypothetical protein